jgi:hypothetical protein
MDEDTVASAGLASMLKRDLANSSSAVNGLACLTILLTWRCPASCDHCVFESSPDNSTTLDPEVARRAVLAASDLRPRPSLSFSGGEPFVELKTMRELMSLGASFGMFSEVVTSCAWAASEKRARSMLSDLSDRGLRSVCVSFDRFHAPFIRAEKIRHTILAALDIGLRVVVNTLLKPRELTTDAPKLAEALGLSLATLQRCFVNDQVTVPVGRARKMVNAFHTPAAPPIGGCSFVGRVGTVAPTGLVYPCCGPVVAEKPSCARLFVQADLAACDQAQATAAMNQVPSDLFNQLLRTAGPYGLVSEAHRRNPALGSMRRFVNHCDACLELATNSGVTSEVERLLGELAPLAEGCQEPAASSD